MPCQVPRHQTGYKYFQYTESYHLLKMAAKSPQPLQSSSNSHVRLKLNRENPDRTESDFHVSDEEQKYNPKKKWYQKYASSQFEDDSNCSSLGELRDSPSICSPLKLEGELNTISPVNKERDETPVYHSEVNISEPLKDICLVKDSCKSYKCTSTNSDYTKLNTVRECKYRHLYERSIYYDSFEEHLGNKNFSDNSSEYGEGSQCIGDTLVSHSDQPLDLRKGYGNIMDIYPYSYGTDSKDIYQHSSPTALCSGLSECHIWSPNSVHEKAEDVDVAYYAFSHTSSECHSYSEGLKQNAQHSCDNYSHSEINSSVDFYSDASSDAVAFGYDEITSDSISQTSSETTECEPLSPASSTSEGIRKLTLNEDKVHRRRQRMPKSFYNSLTTGQKQERLRKLDNERSRLYRLRRREKMSCLPLLLEEEEQKHEKLNAILQRMISERDHLKKTFTRISWPPK